MPAPDPQTPGVLWPQVDGLVAGPVQVDFKSGARRYDSGAGHHAQTVGVGQGGELSYLGAQFVTVVYSDCNYRTLPLGDGKPFTQFDILLSSDHIAEN